MIPIKRKNAPAIRSITLLFIAFRMATLAIAEDGKMWTERRGYGFEGPVHSALTTVERPNPDPRPSGKHALFVNGGPEWIVFDTSGHRSESGSTVNGYQILGVAKRTAVKADGTEVWTDSNGNTTESRKQEVSLPDGSREVTYYVNSNMVTREVSRTDERGRIVASSGYDGAGRLTSEESNVFDDEAETDTVKLYDEAGQITMHTQTRVPYDHHRFDRWKYETEGRLAWHVSVDADGELLSYWHAPDYKPKASSSDSFGIIRPKLYVFYKFDEHGQLEKTVQHIPGKSNIAPDSEEHYNGAGVMDEKVDFKYIRDVRGNWTSRSVFVWDAASNQMIEVERDTRKIEYY